MEDYDKLVMQCAPLIEGKWRYMQSEILDACYHRAALQDDTERGRMILFSEYYLGEGRMQIRGSYPDRHHSDIKITVSRSRSPSAIAADINKRFLPRYIKAYDKAKQIYQSYQNEQQNLQIRADLLKKIDPSMRPHWNSSEVATKYFIDNGTVDLHTYDNKTHLSVHVDFDKLVRILYLINGAK